MKITNKIAVILITIIAAVTSLFGEPNWDCFSFCVLTLIAMELCDVKDIIKGGIISHVFKYSINADKKENSTNEKTDSIEDK